MDEEYFTLGTLEAQVLIIIVVYLFTFKMYTIRTAQAVLIRGVSL